TVRSPCASTSSISNRFGLANALPIRANWSNRASLKRRLAALVICSRYYLNTARATQDLRLRRTGWEWHVGSERPAAYAARPASSLEVDQLLIRRSLAQHRVRVIIGEVPDLVLVAEERHGLPA